MWKSKETQCTEFELTCPVKDTRLDWTSEARSHLPAAAAAAVVSVSCGLHRDIQIQEDATVRKKNREEDSSAIEELGILDKLVQPNCCGEEKQVLNKNMY